MFTSGIAVVNSIVVAVVAAAVVVVVTVESVIAMRWIIA